MAKAQTKASNKYNKEHLAKIQANIQKCDFNRACAFCYLSGMNKAQLITEAIRRYIFEEIKSGTWSDEQIEAIAADFGLTVAEIKGTCEQAKQQFERASDLISPESPDPLDKQ